VVRPAVLHRAAGLVRDRDHAIHLRILAQHPRGADFFRDILAGAGRAVYGADDSDVIAGAVAPIAAVIAHPEKRLRSCRRRRTIAAKRIVPLEGLGGDVMDMDMAAGSNVLTGEADDLPVLPDCFAFGNISQRKLMAEPDPAVQGDAALAGLEL